MYYDSFAISATNIKIYLDADIPKNHVLTPLNLNLTLHSCIFASEPTLPTIVMEGNVPNVETRLTSSNIRKSFKLMDNLVSMMYDEAVAKHCSPETFDKHS